MPHQLKKDCCDLVLNVGSSVGSNVGEAVVMMGSVVGFNVGISVGHANAYRDHGKSVSTRSSSGQLEEKTQILSRMLKNPMGDSLSP